VGPKREPLLVQLLFKTVLTFVGPYGQLSQLTEAG
jgi:hypothetical protein